MKHGLVAVLASLGLMACSSSSSTTSTSGSTGRNGATATASGSSGTSSHLTSSGSSTTTTGATTTGSTTTGNTTTGTTTAGSTTTGTTAGSTTAAGSTGSTGNSTTAAGSTGSTSTAGSTGSTSTAGSTGSTSTAGSTGSTGATTGTAAPDVATARISPDGSAAALTSVLAIMTNSYGPAAPDGGTKYSGRYFVIDPATSAAIFVYKPKSAAALSFDPSRLDTVNVNGTISTYPAPDGGQVQITEANLDILDAGGPGTPLLGAKTALELQLSDTSPDETAVGYFVAVPTANGGSYTQENTPPELAVTVGANTFYDGVALVDSNGNGERILVETYTFKSSPGNCIPRDGGNAPDLTAGGFNGVFDRTVTGDGQSHKVLFYGHCGQ
jgi:hypothetical protein